MLQVTFLHFCRTFGTTFSSRMMRGLEREHACYTSEVSCCDIMTIRSKWQVLFIPTSTLRSNPLKSCFKISFCLSTKKWLVNAIFWSNRTMVLIKLSVLKHTRVFFSSVQHCICKRGLSTVIAPFPNQRVTIIPSISWSTFPSRYRY